MKTRSSVSAIGFRVGAVLGCLPAAAFAAAPKSDIVPPLRREATVDTAEGLTKPKKPAPLAPEITSPFNPTDFEKPDASEIAAGRKPSGGGGQPPVAGGGGGGPRPGTVTTPTPPVAVSGDREILEKLAEMIKPSGTFNLGGKPLLMVQGRRLQVGDAFIVAYDNQDYELALTAISSTTFTLRYRNEETTRPIRPVR